MQLIIRDTNAKTLATIGFDNFLQALGPCDEKIQLIINRLAETGIPFLERQLVDNQVTYIKQIVSIRDSRALSAASQYFINLGFDVSDHHPEVIQKLTERLQTYEDSAEKKDLLKKLPQLSYVEQTALLEQLNQDI